MQILGLNALLLFSLFFNIFCMLGMTYFAFRIMRMQVTPKWTWSLKFASCLIGLYQIFQSVFLIWDIQTFISSFPPTILVISYVIGASRSFLLFVFVARIYFTFKKKFPLS